MPKAFESDVCDKFWGFFLRLSQNNIPVACFLRKNEEKSWNVVKYVVPLQCQKSTTRLKTTKKERIKKL